MSEYTSGNPKPPEHINNPQEHPLKNFFWMLAAVGIIVALILLVVTLATDKIAPLVPFSWEPKMTLMSQNEGQDDASQAALASLESLGQKLAKKADLPNGMSVQFHLLDMEQPNAFATLGGQIYVTTGLLNAVDSENALSMVIAHEIAHIKHRDPIRAAGRSVLMSIVLGALGIGDESAALQSLVTPSAAMSQLSYGRKMETEADSAALSTLSKHYGHIRGSSEFFQAMLNEREEKTYMQWFSSHPLTQDRIDAIQKNATTYRYPTKGALTHMDKALLAIKSSKAKKHSENTTKNP